MTPVSIFLLPHNYRGPLYEYDRDLDGEPYSDTTGVNYLDLPIKMPASIVVTTGSSLDDVLAIDIPGEGGGRIRRKDVKTVWRGVQQFNRDVARQE